MSEEIISFVIATEPVGKARPRFTRFGHPYTPKRTASFERLVKSSARKAMMPRPPYDKETAISLTLDFFYKTPKSWSKRKQFNSVGKPKLSKTDIDNLEKSILDGFNGVVYQDDSSVYELIARKRWADESKIEIIIRADKQ